MADTLWAVDFWPVGFWADGFWTNQGAPEPTPVVQPTGGFFFGFDRHLHLERLRKREEEELAEQRRQIQDETDRQIAELLHAQEAKDAERAELKRLQALADQYAGTKQPVSRRVAAALLKANEERTRNALEQMRREIERMLEEEELVVLQLLLNED